jgi:hypothetical protein
MTFNACAQQKKTRLEKMSLEDIKEIWIYNYFHPGGYTTAGTFGQIIRLEEKNVSKFKLEQNDVDSLCRILQETSPKKLPQTKIGQNLILAEAILKDGQRLMIFSTHNVIGIETGVSYWIKNDKDKEWLFEFRDRIIKKYSTQVRAFANIPKEILENIDKMGIDDNLLLNKYESDYFNVKFQNGRKDFNFTEKKIGFLAGGDGSILSSKRIYFDNEKNNFSRGYDPNYGTLYIFDNNQKEELGGSDAVIVYQSGMIISIKDVMKILKESQSK